MDKNKYTSEDYKMISGERFAFLGNVLLAIIIPLIFGFVRDIRIIIGLFFLIFIVPAVLLYIYRK